jgi:NAD(P)-dependent dehydrogenase (short-subunit alcohol dehydrogenase family)
MSERQRYRDKVALITGAGGGIGRASAERLASEGASLVLADVAEAALVESADAARQAGTRVLAAVADVTRPEDFDALVARAEGELGGLDLLVNNAGIEGAVAPIESYPLDVFDRVLAVNVRGVFLGMRAAAPALRRRGGGAIVNLASVAGVTGDASLSAYVASKHAVIGLTRSGALAFGKDGVRVNAVAPSPVETRMMRSLEAGLGGPQGAEMVKKLVTERIPLGRYAEPAEVAALIAFLGSDEARFITGSTYTIDGGMTPV